ncbi:helix-turn-helix transcriptional regulator [bacterium]|nr:helix-turn-helix transcriptional regulator [bacterium]
MPRAETALINQLALAKRLREGSIKQYLLAQKIGVAPLTVNRWLTGKVKRISLDNLERLAAELKCEAEELTVRNAAELHATQAEQSQAARLLVSRETQSLFVKQGQFASYESLLRAVMHPGMPARDLMATYSSLTMAAAEQSRFEQAREYAQARQALAVRLGDTFNELEARLNLLTIDGASGQLERARRGIQTIVSDARWIPEFRGYGMAVLNLHYISFLEGELDRAVKVSVQLVDFCESRSWLKIKDSLFLQAAMVALEAGEFSLSQRFCRLSIEVQHFTLSPGMRNALSMLRHAADSLSGSQPDPERFRSDLEEYGQSEQRVEASAHLPALVLRRAGKFKEAAEWLRRASASAQARTYDPPFLLAEGARLELAMGHRLRAERMAQRASESFAGLGMLRRAGLDHFLELDKALGMRASSRRMMAELALQEEKKLGLAH